MIRAPLVPTVVLVAAAGCGGDLTLPPQQGQSSFGLEKVQGDGQTGTVGEPLPQPLAVRVTTGGDEPVDGWKVAFVFDSASAAGQLVPDTAISDANGHASSQLVLGTTPGTYHVEARVVAPGDADPPRAEFTASALAAAPAELSAVSSTSQPGRREPEVPEAPTVKVVDRFGNPVPAVPVSWEVTAGEGTVSDPLVATNDAGEASVRWTLGNRIGVHKLVASVEGTVTGSPVTFTASVLF